MPDPRFPGAGALVAALAVAACSDEPAPPIDWWDCATRDSPGRLDCAWFDVPLDHDDPRGPVTTLALVRQPALDRRSRLGTLVLHVGGPGGSTTGWLGEGAVHLLADDDGRLAASFDLLAVDWRGTGASSSAIHCLDRPTWEQMTETPLAAVDGPGWDALAAAVEAAQAGCLARNDPAELARVDTVTAARDLDRVRDALGEDQLSLLTWSYGTRLAATYARMFPDRLRTAVLDSAATDDLDRFAFLRSQALGFEASLGRFFAWCADDGDRCPFGAGRDPAGVAAAYDALLAQLALEPLDGAGGPVGPDVVREATLSSLYFPEVGWYELAEALSEAEVGEPGILDAWRLYWSGLPPAPGADTSFFGYTAVMSVDLPLPDATFDDLRARSDEARIEAPRMGPSVYGFEAYTIGWPFPGSGPLQPTAPSTAPPMLIVGSRHDPATPLAEAEALHRALANGSHLLTYEGDGHATSATIPCVGGAAARWLLTREAPPGSCAGEIP